MKSKDNARPWCVCWLDNMDEKDRSTDEEEINPSVLFFLHKGCVLTLLIQSLFLQLQSLLFMRWDAFFCCQAWWSLTECNTCEEKTNRNKGSSLFSRRLSKIVVEIFLRSRMWSRWRVTRTDRSTSGGGRSSTAWSVVFVVIIIFSVGWIETSTRELISLFHIGVFSWIFRLVFVFILHAQSASTRFGCRWFSVLVFVVVLRSIDSIRNSWMWWNDASSRFRWSVFVIVVNIQFIVTNDASQFLGCANGCVTSDRPLCYGTRWSWRTDRWAFTHREVFTARCSRRRC